MFDKLANALGVGFDKLKNALGLQEQPSMTFPTTSQDLSRSTQIASQEQSRGYYKGIDTSPLKSQLLGEVKNSLGLNYEDAQIAAYQRGMQAGGPQLAAIMGNKPALSDVDLTGGIKKTSQAIGYHISREAGDLIRKSGFSLKNFGKVSGSSGDPKGLYFFPETSKIPADWMSEATSKNTFKRALNIQNPYQPKNTQDYLKHVANPALGARFKSLDELRLKASPQDSQKITEFLQSKGFDGILDEKGVLSFKEPQIIVFDPKQIEKELPLDLNFWTPEQIEKYQYQDIIPKGSQKINNLPGFTTKEAFIAGGITAGLTAGGLALANALGIKPKDNLQSSLDMPDKYEENSAILEKPKYLESEPINEMAGRVKHWSSWSKQYPESYKNLKNAAERVEQEIGIPAELLIDISGIETSGGHSLIQNSDGPGRGYFQFEMPLPSDVKKIADRLFNKQFDPFNAYQSARLAGELIKNRNLSRWGKFGGSWGSIDNQTRDKSERLTTYYSKEELNKYFK